MCVCVCELRFLAFMKPLSDEFASIQWRHVRPGFQTYVLPKFWSLSAGKCPERGNFEIFKWHLPLRDCTLQEDF